MVYHSEGQSRRSHHTPSPWRPQCRAVTSRSSQPVFSSQSSPALGLSRSPPILKCSVRLSSLRCPRPCKLRLEWGAGLQPALGSCSVLIQVDERGRVNCSFPGSRSCLGCHWSVKRPPNPPVVLPLPLAVPSLFESREPFILLLCLYRTGIISLLQLVHSQLRNRGGQLCAHRFDTRAKAQPKGTQGSSPSRAAQAAAQHRPMPHRQREPIVFTPASNRKGGGKEAREPEPARRR